LKKSKLLLISSALLSFSLIFNGCSNGSKITRNTTPETEVNDTTQTNLDTKLEQQPNKTSQIMPDTTPKTQVNITTQTTLKSSSDNIKMSDEALAVQNRKGSEVLNKQVAELFQGDKTSIANTKKIITLIPGVNWGKYASNNFNAYFDFMIWLGHLKIDNIDSMTNILNATYGLDAVFTDAYCDTIKNLFFNNKVIFEKSIDKLKSEQVKKNSSYVHYSCSKEEEIEVKKYFEGITESKGYSVERVEKAKLFMGYFK
jgi:hypothetical protein